MALYNKNNFVSAINADTIEHTVIDAVKGRFTIAPYDGTDKTVYEIPSDVWARQRWRGWFQRAPETSGDESTASVEETTFELSDELKMPEIRELAKKQGITFPVGTKKEDALAQLRDASRKVATDEND